MAIIVYRYIFFMVDIEVGGKILMIYDVIEIKIIIIEYIFLKLYDVALNRLNPKCYHIR